MQQTNVLLMAAAASASLLKLLHEHPAQPAISTATVKMVQDDLSALLAHNRPPECVLEAEPLFSVLSNALADQSSIRAPASCPR